MKTDERNSIINERSFALLLVALGAVVLFFLLVKPTRVVIQTPEAALLPLTASALLIIACLPTVFARPRFHFESVIIRPMLGFLLSMGLYAAGFYYVGIFVSSSVYFFGLMLHLYEYPKQAKEIARILAISLSFGLALWFVFERTLGVYVPHAVLF